MDKSWMKIDARLDPRYGEGVNEFVKFAIDHMGNRDKIRCPCYNCNNVFWLPPDQVGDHLLMNGIVRSYDHWIYHGELANTNNDSEQVLEDIDDNESDDIDGVGDGTWQMLEELNNCDIYHDWANASVTNSDASDIPHQSNTFRNLFGEATKPLYPGCKASNLSFIVKLLHLKIINRWTNKSFTMLLELLQHILPVGAYVPPNYYKAKQVIRDLGLKYEKIDACKNDCVLFRKDLVDLAICPVCNTPRYKPLEEGSKMIAQKVLRYFPLTPRLQRLFISSKTASDMRWHTDLRVKDGNLRHPADSEHWKDFDQKYPYFASDPRNVRLGLSSDGFNPFNNMSNSYSMWPVFVVPYNLPPWRCMKDNFLFLTLLIPGPKGPCNEIDVFLQPLIDELKHLWDEGVETFDASLENLFQMRAALFWTINDFPAYGNLSGWCTKGKLACPVCNKDASSQWLKYGRKICYMGHRRFLPVDHSWRNNRRFGRREYRLPPKSVRKGYH